MDMKKYASKRFYKLDDVQDGPRRETIEDVSEGGYGKPVLTFKSGSRLSLNGTNVGILMEAFSEESDKWLGREIELYRGETKYMGDPRETVLIRTISLPLKPRERSKPVLVPEPDAKEPPADEMDDQIPF
jgi:hypothetical protein